MDERMDGRMDGWTLTNHQAVAPSVPGRQLLRHWIHWFIGRLSLMAPSLLHTAWKKAVKEAGGPVYPRRGEDAVEQEGDEAPHQQEPRPLRAAQENLEQRKISYLPLIRA
jgi:hypothetical protein